MENISENEKSEHVVASSSTGPRSTQTLLEHPAPPARLTALAPLAAHTRLPMSRVKSIMKLDPSVSLASADAVFLVTKATELFLETIAKEAYSYTAKSKKKTVTKKELDTVIDTVDALCFLDGAMDF